MQMDYSKFLNDDFDVKEWVNAAFKSNKDARIESDQYATTVVMKLQMLIQEVNSVVEETSQEVLTSMPRVARDVEALAREAGSLQQQMQMVKNDIQKVEHDTASSMQMLLRLDAVKTRMEAMSQALQEADNWTTLSSDVEEVMQSRDVDAITAKLVGMQHSLRLLTHVVDYEDRCQYLEALKNRLEAIVSPQLIAAFMSSSIDSGKQYARIFSAVNRVPQLCKYYERCQKTKLAQAWSVIVDDVETSSAAVAAGGGRDRSLIAMLARLYDTLAEAWHVQTRWCTQAFGEQFGDKCSVRAAEIVSDVSAGALLSLHPPLPSLFAQHLKMHGDDPLAYLTELKEVTDRFVKTMAAVLPADLPNASAFASAIYEPYRPYMSQYGKMESSYLTRHLDNMRLDARQTDDTVSLLSQSVQHVMSSARLACERCAKLTRGRCYPMLLEALKAYFESYTRDFKRVLINLKEKYRSRQAPATPRQGLKADDSGGEDWSFFQEAFSIVRACGEIITKIQDLDDHICSTLLDEDTNSALDTDAASMATRYGKVQQAGECFSDITCLLLADEEDRRAYRRLVQTMSDSHGALATVVECTSGLCEEAHKMIFDVAFGRIADHVAKLSDKKVWTSTTAGAALTANLPAFSHSPQEYMTKVGQYLLMLPQHLEPFTTEDDPVIIIATRRGKLPYTGEQDEHDHVADLWLRSIARGMMHVYCEEVLRIPEISSEGARQLITDIDYLCNVLDDLGLHASDTLRTIEALLKVAPEAFAEASVSAPQGVAAAVRMMRNIRA